MSTQTAVSRCGPIPAPPLPSLHARPFGPEGRRWLVAVAMLVAAVGCGTEAPPLGGGGNDASNVGDTVAEDTAGQDTGAADVAAHDTAESDTAPDDTTATDATATDTAATDTAATDTAATDTAAPDTSATDSDGPDTSVPDATEADSAAPDTAPTCVPTSPADEVCDGVDNDCDGKTDEQVVCGKGEACVAWSCAGAAGCKASNMSNGAACDDGDPCSKGDTCGAIEGTVYCKPGPNVCDDGNGCTTDKCSVVDAATKCDHVSADDAEKAPCKGDDPCQVGVCVGGSCALKDKCVDGNPCTMDFCVKPGGACNYQPLKTNTPCSLGVCETGLQCFEGLVKCVQKGGDYKQLDCDDKEPCTVDSCHQVEGCKHVAQVEGGTCFDGELCTKNDVCKGGSCVGVPYCDDGQPCTIDVCTKTPIAAGATSLSCTFSQAVGCTACANVGDCAAISTCATVACSAGLCAYSSKEGCADVVVTDVRSEPEKPTVGASAFDTIVKYNSTNFGNKALTGGYSHQLMWSENEVWGDAGDVNITGGCKAIGQQNFIKPEPGQTVAMTMSCTLPAKKSGTYYLLVRANNVQGDDDPSNNTTAAKLDVTYAEMANIKALSFVPKDKPNYTAGATEKLTMTLTAQNNGNAASPQIPYTTFWTTDHKNAWAKKTKICQNGSLPALQPGAEPYSISLFTQTSYGSKGVINFCAWIDPDNTVPEWNEGDNISCVSMQYK